MSRHTLRKIRGRGRRAGGEAFGGVGTQLLKGDAPPPETVVGPRGNGRRGREGALGWRPAFENVARRCLSLHFLLPAVVQLCHGSPLTKHDVADAVRSARRRVSRRRRGDRRGWACRYDITRKGGCCEEEDYHLLSRGRLRWGYPTT